MPNIKEAYNQSKARLDNFAKNNDLQTIIKKLGIGTAAIAGSLYLATLGDKKPSISDNISSVKGGIGVSSHNIQCQSSHSIEEVKQSLELLKKLDALKTATSNEELFSMVNKDPNLQGIKDILLQNGILVTGSNYQKQKIISEIINGASISNKALHDTDRIVQDVNKNTTYFLNQNEALYISEGKIIKEYKPTEEKNYVEDSNKNLYQEIIDEVHTIHAHTVNLTGPTVENTQEQCNKILEKKEATIEQNNKATEKLKELDNSLKQYLVKGGFPKHFRTLISNEQILYSLPNSDYDITKLLETNILYLIEDGQERIGTLFESYKEADKHRKQAFEEYNIQEEHIAEIIELLYENIFLFDDDLEYSIDIARENIKEGITFNKESGQFEANVKDLYRLFTDIHFKNLHNLVMENLVQIGKPGKIIEDYTERHSIIENLVTDLVGILSRDDNKFIDNLVSNSLHTETNELPNLPEIQELTNAIQFNKKVQRDVQDIINTIKANEFEGILKIETDFNSEIGRSTYKIIKKSKTDSTLKYFTLPEQSLTPKGEIQTFYFGNHHFFNKESDHLDKKAVTKWILNEN